MGTDCPKDSKIRGGAKWQEYVKEKLTEFEKELRNINLRVLKENIKEILKSDIPCPQYEEVIKYSIMGNIDNKKLRELAERTNRLISKKEVIIAEVDVNE